GNDDPGHEVLVFAGRLAGVVEPQAHDLVAGPFRTIPGAVQRDEVAALVGSRKIRSYVDPDLRGRGVRLHQHVRNRRLALQVRPSGFVARVAVGSDVVPGPTVET